MNEQVLETSQFPLIVYEAPGASVSKMGDSLFAVKLDGKLTFHGVTRSESVTTRVALMGSMIRASGEFSLSQSNYAIKPISVAGGALKLKDEIKFSFEIVARKQD
jgi:polyisoprenoid-binding protein YceI